MGVQVVTSGVMVCSFGTAPSTLIALPKGPPVVVSGLPAATIMDHLPIANIPPFVMCSSPVNPVVIAARILTKNPAQTAPCVPVTPAPWLIGSPTVIVNNFPTLNNTSKCMCVWGGVIQITFPGQMQVMVP